MKPNEQIAALSLRIARKIWRQFDAYDYKPDADHVHYTAKLIRESLALRLKMRKP